MKMKKEHVEDFFRSEQAGGIILIGCTVLSLLLANSVFGQAYQSFWHAGVLGMSLEHWINDGLMAVFFFFVGLELKREILQGELSDFRKASLALAAAVGGMIVPALAYSLFNYGTDAQSGAGIPMATDIVFAIGILSLLGSRVPAGLTVLLTALAVIDDLGAIVVIAIFYTSSLSWGYLLAALAAYGMLLLLQYFKVAAPAVYLIGGVVLWYCMLHSGVHATIAGVLLAFAVPFGDGGPESLSHRFEHALDTPVTFAILPVFALANTAIILHEGWTGGLMEPSSLGIIFGLWAGKPAGIVLFSMVAVMFKFSTLPSALNLKHILGMGFLGGIGFTMSIFITLLAFTDAGLIGQAKIAILCASLCSGITGYIWLRLTLAAPASQHRPS